ncbi:MAG: Ig-like domain-containing protein [Campylobacterota bacterium]|nr:Ig-like domain-containing protein [Campylobacterota bacterium]
MRFLIFLILGLVFFTACEDRGYGTQDVSTVKSVLSTDKVTILSSAPKSYIAQSSYINIEFSSHMDINSFFSSSIILKEKESEIEVDLEWDIVQNRLHVMPQESLVPNRTYRLLVAASLKDIFGNSMLKSYEVEFLCVESFWQSVELGETHSMALSLDGDIYTWGSNEYGQLLSNDTRNRSIPFGVLNISDAKNYSAGLLTSAVIKDDSTLVGAGINALMINADDDFKMLSIGNNHSVVIKNDGTLWSWGANSNGQIGNKGIFKQPSLTQEHSKDDNWTTASASNSFTIALKNDGTMWGWGNNEFGQIGNARYKERRVPVQEDTNASDWKIISAGSSHSVAIKEDGTLWSWGKNDSGELGDGTNDSSVVQTQEATASSWSSVSAGYNHTVAIKEDGTLWAWGDNYYGQVGDDTTQNTNTPLQIGLDTGDATWTSVSAGNKFSAATKSDGTLWVWGYNAHEQLGLGSDGSDKLKPTELK